MLFGQAYRLGYPPAKPGAEIASSQFDDGPLMKAPGFAGGWPYGSLSTSPNSSTDQSPSSDSSPSAVCCLPTTMFWRQGNIMPSMTVCVCWRGVSLGYPPAKPGAFIGNIVTIRLPKTSRNLAQHNRHQRHQQHDHNRREQQGDLDSPLLTAL